jgi:hypothetical protein
MTAKVVVKVPEETEMNPFEVKSAILSSAQLVAMARLFTKGIAARFLILNLYTVNVYYLRSNIQIVFSGPGIKRPGRRSIKMRRNL